MGEKRVIGCKDHCLLLFNIYNQYPKQIAPDPDHIHKSQSVKTKIFPNTWPKAQPSLTIIHLDTTG